MEFELCWNKVFQFRTNLRFAFHYVPRGMLYLGGTDIYPYRGLGAHNKPFLGEDKAFEEGQSRSIRRDKLTLIPVDSSSRA